MAKEKFSAKKIDFSNINGGYRYENGDAISADAINAPIEAVGLVQSLGETQPDNTEADREGVASVSIVTDNNGFPKFKFSNLKGKTGAKIVSTELVGQDENGGNIYKQTFDNGSTATFVAPRGGSATLDQLNKKLDKVTDTNTQQRVYGVETNGRQVMVITSTSATTQTIPRRGADGNFNVNCNNPTTEERCANLKWVKDYVANNGGGGLELVDSFTFVYDYGWLGKDFFAGYGKYLFEVYVEFVPFVGEYEQCRGLLSKEVNLTSGFDMYSFSLDFPAYRYPNGQYSNVVVNKPVSFYISENSSSFFVYPQIMTSEDIDPDKPFFITMSIYKIKGE